MEVATHDFEGSFLPQVRLYDSSAPLSPDLQNIDIVDIMKLLSDTLDSEESGDSDNSDIPSPSPDLPQIYFPSPESSQNVCQISEPKAQQRRRSDSDSPKTPDANIELRSGLSVRDITSEYDSKLIATHGKRRGRKPSIKSWRRKNEYSDLLKKVIEKYQCENTSLRYEAMQLEKTKREMLKILGGCHCQNGPSFGGVVM